jgi:hypothetical protein
MPNNLNYPRARSRQLVVETVKDEVLVYDLANDKAHCLNKPASFIWSACDGTKSVSEIASMVSSEFGSGVSEDYVGLALAQLGESSLLEDKQYYIPSEHRREWIKRVGMASVIALPVIASLVAPRSALAAASCACVNPGACLTQTGCPNTANCNGSGVCAP